MRIASVNASKNKSGKGRPCRESPLEGSALRGVFDLFKANAGYPVTIPLDGENRGRLLSQLRDFYGLDIRRYPGYKHNLERAKYWLVGEYIGKDYVDYIIQRREKEEREAKNDRS